MEIPDLGRFDRTRTVSGAAADQPVRGCRGRKRYHRAGAPSLATGNGASPHEQPSRSSKPQSFIASASDSFAPTCFSIAAEYALHIFFCSSRPASVISTNSPPLSILHSRRAARPSSTSRSINREVEYCGISICFSNSTGRISPVGARDSSSSASYQASGGKPAFFSSCSTASSTRLWTRIRRIQAAVASVDGLRFMAWPIDVPDLVYRTKCSCINLDYFMQTHLVMRWQIANNPEGRKIPMKLYYSPGACSLSPHIALLEAGLPYDLVKVDLRAKKLENGDDYLKVNPKGQVPALALDSGELVTEGPVIVQMIADKVAAKNLAPARDAAERYKLLEWLNYITTELHKNLGPMFSPVLADDAKAFFKDRAMGKFKYLETQLAGRDYLMGKQFTVADGYLFTMLMWATDRLNFDLSGLPNLTAYKARVAARPKVQEALTKEGLMKAA